MAVYDDIATERIGDYAEIYNLKGALIAIIWFDEFGILRTAIDRGVVLHKKDVEGVLVLVMNGDLVQSWDPCSLRTLFSLGRPNSEPEFPRYTLHVSDLI
jgi:hypothetical protein